MEDNQDLDRPQPSFEQPPDEPVFDEPVFDEPVFDEPVFDEPTFPEEEPALDDLSEGEPSVGEPVFDEPVFDEPAFDEPVFEDAFPGEPEMEPASGLVLEPDAAPTMSDSASTASVAIDEYAPFDELSPVEATPAGARRRLGRTGPFWIMIVALAAIVVLAIALPDREQTPAVENTPAVANVPAAEAPEAAVVGSPTPAPTPTATPIPLLTPGQRVIVGNTDGQGIRLRGSPGLNGLTLAIYDDGQPFEVLEPGSEYAAYPVEVDGYRWYRLRVADDPTDQLVGWAAGDFLIIDSQP